MKERSGTIRDTADNMAIQQYADHHVRTAMALFEWHLDTCMELAMDEYTQDYYAILTCE